ncbi:MAG: hypothetical protein KGN16_00170 [Burkholderiales bacterium]|nr:hypothetical protein [Burkholderiales bacterium]
MIALWGIPGDGPLDAVAASLRQQGAAFALIDQREASRCQARQRLRSGRAHLTLKGPEPGQCLDFDTVGAFYLRPHATSQALALRDITKRQALDQAAQVDQALIQWADLAPSGVVNPPAAMAANHAKPYQLQLIQAMDFEVPPTLVTTEPEAVREFAALHGRLIYKSVSGVRSIVNMLDDHGLARLDDVAHVPTQFQAWVPGTDVRVHVVGEAVFATEIVSEANDYRYASKSGYDVALAETRLPSGLAQRCIRMAAGMGLKVAGIDLRRTPDNHWFCFEVNPSPAFTYYEAATGQPIAAAIARLLMRADASGAAEPADQIGRLAEL